METQTTSKTVANAIFESQQHNALGLKKLGFEERLSRLQKLKQVVIDYSDPIFQALYNDFKKPAEEAQFELDGIVGALDRKEWARLIYKHLDHHLKQYNSR